MTLTTRITPDSLASGGAVVTNVNDLRLAMFILEQDASEERMHFRSWPINGMVLLMLELNNAVCQVASSVDNVDLRVSWMQL